MRVAIRSASRLLSGCSAPRVDTMDIVKTPSLATWPNNGSSDKMALYSSDLDEPFPSQQPPLSRLLSQSVGPHYCALGEIATKIQSPSDLSLYSKKHRKALFLNWVAYERLHNEQIFREERFTCPLVWCRLLFHEPKKLLDHVKTCDELESGEYYCEDHAMKERFALSTVEPSTLSIKLSVIVSRAIRIIRKLGSKRSKRVSAVELDCDQMVLPTASKMDCYHFTTKDIRSKYSEAVLAVNAHERIELSTTRSQYRPCSQSQCYEHSSPTLTSSEPILSEPIFDGPRLLGNDLCPPHYGSNTTSSVNDIMDVDAQNNIEPALDHSKSPPDSDYEVVDSNTTSPSSPWRSDTSTVYSQNTGDVSHQTYIATSLANPGSVIDSADHPIKSCVPVNPKMSCFDNGLISAPGNDTLTTPSALNQGGIEIFSDKIFYAFNCNAELNRKTSGNKIPEQSKFSKQTKVSKQSLEMQGQLSLVEGLRKVSELLYKRSIKNLRRNPVPDEIQQFIDMIPPLDHIAEKGLTTLRKVFSGCLPSTLMEVYSMIHVAYVVAIVVNQKEVTEVQDDLYADIFNWSLAIKSVPKRALFVDVARRIWALENSSIIFPRDAIGAIDGLSGTPNQTCFARVLPRSNGSPLSNSSELTRTEAFGMSIYSAEHDVLFQVLRGGTAIYLCRQYMDILEYTDLLSSERGRHLAQMEGCKEKIPSSQEMETFLYWVREITEPLITFIGLEGFRSMVVNVQKLILNGVFRNLREVELKLIYDAKHCSRSPTRYHSFLKEVQRLCEKVLESSPLAPFSYDTQYRNNIGITLCILRGLKYDSSALDVSSPQTRNCANNSNRMTNKDLKPIVTEKDLPTLPMNNHFISSSSNSSTALSASSASSSNLASGSSKRSIFSSSATVSSNSPFSFINSSPESHIRNAFQPSPTECGAATPASQKRRASKSQDSNLPSMPCPITSCTEIFHGTSQKTNCSRHVNSVHGQKRLRCTFEDCTQDFNRSDNLRSHEKKVHKRNITY